MTAKTKKVIFLLLFIVILLLGVFVYARYSGALQFYTSTSSSNEPSILENSYVFATNLIAPKKYKLILYKQDKLKHIEGIWIHRLCGVENDRLEIKNGALYVNDTLIDKRLTLKHLYLVDENFKNWLLNNSKIKENETYMVKNNAFLANISDTDLNKKFYFKKYISESYNDTIIARFNQLWNEDNFGPVTVPLNHIFVLGDNRNNSMDSRFIGFIHKSKIKGVVLGHK